MFVFFKKKIGENLPAVLRCLENLAILAFQKGDAPALLTTNVAQEKESHVTRKSVVDFFPTVGPNVVGDLLP